MVITKPINHGSLIHHKRIDDCHNQPYIFNSVSYTHLRAHETPEHLVCRLLLENRKICSLSTGLAEFMGRTRRVHEQMHPTCRVGSCTRRVGACWAVFSSFVVGNGLKSLSQSVLDL